MMDARVAAHFVTRVELIDHRTGAKPFGRRFSAEGVSIELSFQDGGRTLKVFVDDIPAEAR